MAEENQNNISHGYQPAAPTHTESETKEPGMLDFLRKKKEELLPTAAAAAAPPQDESEVKSRGGMFDFLKTKKEGEEENKENQNNISHGYQQPAAPATSTTHEEEESEIKDRGMLDFLGKKKEEEEEEKVVPAETHGYQQPPAAPATYDDESEIKDRGMLDFLGKKKEEENKDEQHIPISHGNYQPAAPATTTTDHEEESEIKDRGMFDFLKKKKEEEDQKVVPTAAHQNVVIGTELEQGHVPNDQCEEPEKKVAVHEVNKEDEKKHHTSLLEKLQRSNSSSSSSSDEEVEEAGKKIRRKKNKGLKEKIHEKISGDHNKVEQPEKKIDYYDQEDTTVPIEKSDDVVVTHEGETPHPEEKKGFLEKIKGKIHKKPEDHQAGITHPVVAPAAPAGHPVTIDHHEYNSTTDAADHHDIGEEAKEKKGFLEKIKEKFPGYHKNEDHEEKKDTPTHY